MPRVGEKEEGGKAGRDGRRFKHRKVVEAKPLDRFRGDYDRKVRQLKKKPEDEGETKGKKMGLRRGGKRVKSEIKTVEQIRKGRKVVANRKAKNARPRRGGRRR